MWRQSLSELASGSSVKQVASEYRLTAEQISATPHYTALAAPAKFAYTGLYVLGFTGFDLANSKRLRADMN